MSTTRGRRARRRSTVCGTILGLLASMIVLGAAPTRAAAAAPPAGTVTEYGRSLLAGAWGVATGADGNIWFTNEGNNRIGRVTPTGTFTSFSSPNIDKARDITSGPDGSLWFLNLGTYPNGSSVGRITTAGVVTKFDAPPLLDIAAITAGPDGNIWFTVPDKSMVVRMTTAGALTTYTSPGISWPTGITSGPDGALWFANRSLLAGQPPASIGRITTGGAVTTFTSPLVGVPNRIVAGSDGALWFSKPGSDSIGRITTDGTITALADPSVGSVDDLTSGPDGAIWFLTTKFTSGGLASGLTRVTTAGAFTDFGDPLQNGTRRITAGPDGNLWFSASHDLGRVTPAGVITRIADTLVRGPADIAQGPDGNMWFTNRGNDTVVRVLPTGAMTSFTAPGVSGPGPIAAGPDGALWFGNVNGTVSRMTTAGAVTTFTVPETHLSPTSITAGPDGALWFGTLEASRLWRLSTNGTFTSFQDPKIQYPTDITTGSDGALWFTNTGNATIGRITPAGVITSFSNPKISQPQRITAGPDGALWFINIGGSTQGASIGRITVGGQMSFYSDPSLPSAVSITAGSDGALWFTTSAPAFGIIGRIAVDGTITSITSFAVDRPSDIAAGADGGVWFTNIGIESIGRVQTDGVPSKPRNVAATPALTSAAVTWSPPAAPGSLPITGYTVTASPGGATCSWTTGPLTCTVAGLTPGVAYTFTARATNSAGTGAPSDPSGAVTPGPGSTYHGVEPFRIADSRLPSGGLTGIIHAGAPQDLAVGGVHGIPADATAVIMNVTVTQSDLASFVTVWPSGTGRPTSSNLNFGPGDTRANLVTAKLGPDGKVTLGTAQGSVHIVADVYGYFDHAGGAAFTGISPVRALDTRTFTGNHYGPLGDDAPMALPISGSGAGLGIPADATAVVANVTATGGSSGSFLSVYADAAVPGTSSINFGRGDTIPNLVTMKIGAGGVIHIANAIGYVDVVVDVVGWFGPSGTGLLHPVIPRRVLDNRVGNGLTGRFLAGQPRSLTVAGTNSIPTDATGVIANITATNGTANSFVSVRPHGAAVSEGSTLNFATGQTVPNLTMTKLGPGGALDLVNQLGSVDLIADVVGYYATF